MIFVDTGAWYALMDATDPNHAPARGVFRDLARGKLGRLVTSDYVLAEAHTLCRFRGGIEPLRQLAARVRESPNLRMLRVTEVEYERALDLMLTREDRRWSFTDCTSFVLMESLSIRDAFAFDENFAQAGFSVRP
jgi:predicted nucleic acid-binding protein